MSTHARCSASAAHRWTVCQGSINQIAGRNPVSFAAAEGTFAHDLAAQCLRDSSISPSDFLLKRGKVDGFDIECDLEMVEGIQVYVDAINDDTQEGDCFMVEKALDKLQTVDQDLGGTGDCVRYRPANCSLGVYDFKYGAGVYVEAVDNLQAKIYALGALLEIASPVVEVEVVIVQPRFEGAAPVRRWKFAAIYLLDFAADLAEKAAATRNPAAPLVAGDHCKFCAAAPTCPELEKKSHALMAAQFAVLDTVTPEQLASALALVPQVKERIKAVEEFAYAAALKGIAIPGYKLVDKRPVRRWKSEGEVALWAQERAVDPYEPRSLLSPAQLEKKLAEAAPKGQKKKAGEALAQFIEKVSSGTALVPVSDDRPPVKTISMTDFAVIDGAAGMKQSAVSELF